MFFVEARYHRSPKRAADNLRYIAHREEALPDGRRRELYGIGARYRAFRGDEHAIRRALVEDGRGLRNPVYFRFILTVDNRTAERFARLEPRIAERVIRDAVQKTFRSAARGVRGAFAVHQHGGADRVAHPHAHVQLSPRLESGAPIHIAPQRIQRVKERWEGEVLRSLERQERRIERPRGTRTPPFAVPPRIPVPVPTRTLLPLKRQYAPASPLALAFFRGRKILRALDGRPRWDTKWLRAGDRLNAVARKPERFARRATFRLMAGLLPRPMREALSLMREMRGFGLQQR